VFKALDDLNGRMYGTLDEGDEGGIPYLRFSAEAQSFFDEWRTDLEIRLRSEQLAAYLESHLAKYRSLMPSLALHLHLISSMVQGSVEPVSLLAAQPAGAWCDLLEEHALRIYQSAVDGDIEPAQQLAERIKQSVPNPFTVRLVVKKGWSGLDTSESVEQAIAVLEDHGWLVREEKGSGPEGGRPTTLFHINPDVLAAPH
jgi:hypothetical protein